ncbi:MAG: DUF4214 domain-containing protein [Pseudomonadota bacterium]
MKQRIAETPLEPVETSDREDATFDPDGGPGGVSADAMLYTSWVVDRPVEDEQETYGEMTVDIHLPAFDPAERPEGDASEDAFMTTSTDDQDGGGGDFAHLPAFDPIVDELYKVIFGRLSDDGGRDFWSFKTFGGTTVEEVADIFLDSAEFTDRWGDDLSDEDFVEGTYLRTLGRDADEGGKAFWVDRLADEDFGRGDLAVAFARFSLDTGETEGGF